MAVTPSQVFADTHLTQTGMDGTLVIQGDLELEGTLVGTVVGQDPDTGATLLDHVLSFDNGEMFTYGDIAILAPTVDPCVMSVWEHMHTWSGNGDFDGLTSGNVIVEGTVNVCTGENDLAFSGELCFIAPVPGDLDGDGDIDYDDYGVLSIVLVASVPMHSRQAPTASLSPSLRAWGSVSGSFGLGTGGA